MSAPADTSDLLEGSCHCGRVKLEIPSLPTELNDCQCSICYRYGTLWAYYPRDQVKVTVSESGEEQHPTHKAYRREDMKPNHCEFWFCTGCGCMTNWWGRGAKEDARGTGAKMGVNARMFPTMVVEGAKRVVNYK